MRCRSFDSGIPKRVGYYHLPAPQSGSDRSAPLEDPKHLADRDLRPGREDVAELTDDDVEPRGVEGDSFAVPPHRLLSLVSVGAGKSLLANILFSAGGAPSAHFSNSSVGLGFAFWCGNDAPQATAFVQFLVQFHRRLRPCRHRTYDRRVDVTVGNDQRASGLDHRAGWRQPDRPAPPGLPAGDGIARVGGHRGQRPRARAPLSACLPRSGRRMREHHSLARHDDGGRTCALRGRRVGGDAVLVPRPGIWSAVASSWASSIKTQPGGM